MWNETRAEFSTTVTKPENGEEKQFGEKGNDVSRHIVLYIKADCFHTVEDTQEQDGPNHRLKLDGAIGQGEICNSLKSDFFSKSFLSHIGKN